MIILQHGINLRVIVVLKQVTRSLLPSVRPTSQIPFTGVAMLDGTTFQSTAEAQV